jgi:hypothetical protein
VAEPVVVDIVDKASFQRLPPCADSRFDHRSCDYWEDADRGSKLARPSWSMVSPSPTRSVHPSLEDNPFAPTSSHAAANPFAPPSPSRLGGFDADADDALTDDALIENPFAPARRADRPMTTGVPRKLALLDRGRGVFGSYAKVLTIDDEAVAYAQFGPLSAYPRAMRLRELYPRLPSAPPPGVITCIATTAAARHQGHARRLVELVCSDLAGRGFAAVEAYPDLTRDPDETSGAWPAFWVSCGFSIAIPDERFPVVRRNLE